jgi:hypothetical protein
MKFNKADIVVLFSMFAFVVLFVLTMQYITESKQNLEFIANRLEVREKLEGVGNNGIFNSKTQNILVDTTNRSNYDVCLTFLHELGHKIDYQTNPDYFNSSYDAETFAIQYASDNAWRCEGI